MTERFALSSEQLELLLAFEKFGSLQRLAEALCRDSSVISRNLQRLGETSPVIVKARGRWTLSPLGFQVNQITRSYLKEFGELLGESQQDGGLSPRNNFSNAALIVVNAQNGLSMPSLGNRSNEKAEENILMLLKTWRSRNTPIVHVRHVSKNPSSPFFRKSSGVELIPALANLANELVLDKTKSSAFTETSLH